MAEDFNNDVVDEQTKTSSTTDEVVDDIPQNAKNINESIKQTYSSANTKETSAESPLISILSLALGIFSVICCCTFVPSGISAAIGLTLGIIALRSNNAENKTFAIIGIILCSIGLAIFLISGAAAIIFGSINAVFEVPATMHSMTM